MTRAEQIWDISQLGATTSALTAECPSCHGYLHPYATECFGCGCERGTANLDLPAQWSTISKAPIPSLLQNSYLAEVAKGRRLLDGGLAEMAIRRELWLANRRAQAGLTALNPEFDAKRSYLGGLPSAPDGEYIHFAYSGGYLVLDGNRTSSRLASIKPSSVLAMSPYTAGYVVFGGATVGFCSAGVAIFHSLPPPEGGALKIVFADEQGRRQLVSIGNRTGLTDKWYSLDAYRSLSCVIGKMCLFEMVGAEWSQGPQAYSRSLGLEVPDARRTRTAAIRP